MKHLVITLVACGLLVPAAGRAADAAPVMRLGTKPQELILAKITVSDLEKSYDFYTRVVGLKPTNAAGATAARASKADFIELGLNHSGSSRDAALILVRQKGAVPVRTAAKLTWVAFKVPDVAAAIGRIKAEGLEIRNEVTAYGGGKFGVAYDPDGYTVEFLEAPNAE
jgi:catechol 2,3-dioxygenase-like lactoylglutathione lyase family enzyme